MDLNPTYLKAMHITNLVFCSIGLICCILFAIVLIVKRGKIALAGKKYINISFLISSTALNVSLMFGQFKPERAKEHNILCELQAIFTTGGGFAGSFLSVSSIIVVCLQFECTEWAKAHPKLFVYSFATATWIFTFIFEGIVIVENKFRQGSALYCLPYNGNLTYVYGYTILSTQIASIVILLYLGTRILATLRRRNTNLIGAEDKEENPLSPYIRYFLKYFITQVYCCFFFVFDLIVKRSYDFDREAVPYHIWNFFVQTGYAEMGLIIILVYGYNDIVWNFYNHILWTYEGEDEERPSQSDDTTSGGMAMLKSGDDSETSSRCSKGNN